MKTARSFLALAILALPSIASAQTSGTLTTQTAQSWTTAPWVITAGAGTFPDGGGVATWNTHINTTIGTVAASATVTINTPITLSGITYNSPFSMTLAGTAVNNLGLTTTGTNTFNVILSIANTPTLFQLANNISAPITGGGTFGLTKTGSGTMTMSGANTYTGGTHINGGILVASGANGDSTFGTAGAGNGISMDGGAIFNNLTGGWTSSRDIALGAGGGTIYTNTAATLNGVISGSGSFNNAGFAAVSLTLTGINTYTGATINAQNVSSMILSGTGSIAQSSSYDLMGSLALTNTGTNVTDRLSDTAAMTLRGLNFVDTGNAAATSSETIGAVTLASSLNTFLVTPGAGAGNSVTMASLTRTNNSTVGFRGTGLGGTPGSGVANINSTAAPALIGGGGAAGSTTISILPWAYGNSSSATANTAAGLVGSSFVTNGVNGFRPLATAEYAAAFGGNATDNVRLTATTAAGAGVTANSVLFAPAAAATLSGGTINITSGAFLYSPTADATGTVSATLDFGSAEGVITNTSALILSGVLMGSNGVTYTTASAPSSPVVSTITLSGASTYTGNTTINSGTIGLSGTVAAAGSSSVFGNSGTIVLAGGANFTSLFATAATTLNRNISVIGTGTNYVASSGTGYTFTLNGTVNLANNLFIFGNLNTAANAFIFNGDISGTGGIIDTTFGFDIFNGNNTYSGGTTLPGTTTFVAGSDTAFGTGPIYVTGAGTLMGSGATPRTLANNFLLSSSFTLTGTAQLTFTGGINLNGARTLTVSNTQPTIFSGVVSNGALTKSGAGLLSLNSPTGNTYTGGTVLGASAGTLNVNNTSGSGTGSGTVSIGTGTSTLSGNFTISGATTVNGRLTPGNSVGTANFGSSLSLGTAAITTFELGSAASADDLNVSGLFTLDGSVVVLTIGGYIAQQGDSFDLIDWGTINSAGFNVAADLNLTGAATAPGTSWDTSNFLTLGMIMVVPEPSTWTMMGVGASMLLVMMRLRRRSS
jgi:fibronectin-binding autotransporter adhesin